MKSNPVAKPNKSIEKTEEVSSGSEVASRQLTKANVIQVALNWERFKTREWMRKFARNEKVGRRKSELKPRGDQKKEISN